MADYIDREAAFKTVENAYNFCKSGSKKDFHDCMVESFKVLPAADVKPVVHGKWLLKERDGSWACWTCSECGRIVHLTDYYRKNVQIAYPFCHCGADMRGDENEKN